MNEIVIRELLAEWTDLIITSKKACIKKASKTTNGLHRRIKRTSGKPVVFDFKTYEQQQKIQNALCLELPGWADLIRSEPEIMNGYSWTIADFIDLYHSHFTIVVEKLSRIILQKNNM